MTKTIAPEQEKLIDFKTISEEWNQYELEDRTLIKSKFVLVNIIQKGPLSEGVYQALFSSQNVTGVYSPVELRGTPGQKYSVDELGKHIIQHNLKFKQTVDGGWNEYETENSIIQVRNILKRVDKTSLFDSAGMPAYLVNFEAIVTVKPKTKPATN